MAITRVATSAVSGYGAVIDKPSGLSAIPYVFVARVAWFYQPDAAPTLAGFTLVAVRGDGEGAGGDSNVAIFVKAVADGAAAASTYAFSTSTGVNDCRGSITAYTGLDTTTPISAFTSNSRITAGAALGFPVSGATVATTGSVVCVAGGAFNFVWGYTPSGWTRTVGTGGEEVTDYEYGTTQSAGTSVSFAMDPAVSYFRLAGILYVLQPAGGGGGGGSTPSVGRRALLGVGF